MHAFKPLNMHTTIPTSVTAMKLRFDMQCSHRTELDGALSEQQDHSLPSTF